MPIKFNVNKKNIDKKISSILQNKVLNVKCPHCGKMISAKPGKSICSSCGKQIDLKIN